MKKVTICDYELGRVITTEKTDSERLAKVVKKRINKINKKKSSDFE